MPGYPLVMMVGMRILVIGSGGREHALVKGLSADPKSTEIHAAPGSAAMSALATVHPDYSQVDDADRMVELAQSIAADLVVIGPEVPLVAGVADALRAAGIAVFGPSKDAAQIEGSKAFAKDVMESAGVKTARAHVDAVLAAGSPVLLESFLDGPEVSLFCLVDGETVVPLLPAQDHKRAYDNDEGPNTGGMGAYTPLPWLPEDGVQRIVDEVCTPVAKEMARRGTPYSGLLYAGLAWGEEGPAVVEFNCRFGDPETQAVLSLLKSPLAEALYATATGTLSELPPLEWEDGFAVIIVMAAEGYPASPRKGDAISGAALDDPQRVLHAGTVHTDGAYRTAGGRVLSVLGKGATLADARADAYATVDGIEFAGGFVRRDIGKRAEDGEISL